ncbi:MAG: CRTAC1 family protein [Planctomycetota bacterium]
MNLRPLACAAALTLSATPLLAQPNPFARPRFERVGNAFPSDTKGTRVAFGDVDRDGDPDVLISGRLFLNDGSGRFSLAPVRSRLRQRVRAAAFADYDRDGDLDVFLSGTDAGQDKLLRNDTLNGSVRFTDVSATLGVTLDDGLPGEGVAWGDVNGDGYPDLFVANYERGQSNGTLDRLYVSTGDGRFRAEYQLVLSSQVGRGANLLDVDRDGDVDVFVSNYRLDRNLLWVNQRRDSGTLRFLEQAVQRGIAGDRSSGGSYGHTIGSDWGDLDGDGDFDLVSANLAHPQYLSFSDRTYVYLQRSDRTFAKTTAGIAYEETHSNPTLFDADNDGDLDLHLTSVYGGRPSFLYRNRLREDGSFSFRDVSAAADAVHNDGWGAAVADVDLDGDLDLVVCAGGKPRLLRNTIPPRMKSVRIKLRGRRSERYGAGATVRLIGNGAGRQVRQLTLGHGTTSQNRPILHFGVGTTQGPYRVKVWWPSGRVSDVRLDVGLHTLREPPKTP